MGRKGQLDCVVEGLLSREEGNISVRSPYESDSRATLAGLHHGVNWMEQEGTVRDEAVIEVKHTQACLELALDGRFRKLLDGFSL